jgi:gluconate 2-dehydrogenase gamma chain
MKRRQFLLLTGATIGGQLVYSLDRKFFLNAGQDKPKTMRVPLRFLTEGEALTLAAAVGRIFPSDDFGPGANEAGVVIYIDRQLGGPWGRDRYRYTQEPFDEDSPADFGYQGKATPRQLYREGLKNLAGLEKLSPKEQDEKLKQIENTPFFAFMRKNTIEGMFCDPLHGGNIDLIGWQLLGFPGPQMSYADAADKNYGEAFRPKPVSLQQMMPGHKFHLLEDEDNEKPS